MPERKAGAKRTRRPTAAEISAGTANLAAGREAMAKKRAEAKAKGGMKAKERWAMLLDGTLRYEDLSDKEVEKMRVRNADGTFGGKGRAMPSHIAQGFHNERVRRAEARLKKGLPAAMQAMENILKDPEAKDADKIKLIQIYLDRNLGKTPETIRIEGESPFDLMLKDGASMADIRDLSDLAGEVGNSKDFA